MESFLPWKELPEIGPNVKLFISANDLRCHVLSIVGVCQKSEDCGWWLPWGHKLDKSVMGKSEACVNFVLKPRIVSKHIETRAFSISNLEIPTWYINFNIDLLITYKNQTIYVIFIEIKASCMLCKSGFE